MDGAAVRRAMTLADEQAWAAVAAPVEGTILSVSRAAAAAAAPRSAGRPAGRRRRGGARGRPRPRSPARPSSSPALRRAGVVDAGGQGLVVLLETLADVVAGGARRRASGRAARPCPSVDLAACDDLDAEGPAYEVMYLLEAPDEQVAGAARAARAARRLARRRRRRRAVARARARRRPRAPPSRPGSAPGRPRRVRIAHFAEQIARRGAAPARRGRAGRLRGRPGPGAAVRGGRRRRRPDGARAAAPRPGRSSTASARTGAAAVVVLPNDAATRSPSRAPRRPPPGTRASGWPCCPTRAQVQGLAAAAVHDPGRAPDADVVADERRRRRAPATAP